jgi:hypothetical protein
MVDRFAKRHGVRVWVLWAIGLLLLIGGPTALLDPAAVMFVFDPELLALSVAAGAALLGSTSAGRAASAVAARWQEFGRRTWSALLVRAPLR